MRLPAGLFSSCVTLSMLVTSLSLIYLIYKMGTMIMFFSKGYYKYLEQVCA